MGSVLESFVDIIRVGREAFLFLFPELRQLLSYNEI